MRGAVHTLLSNIIRGCISPMQEVLYGIQWKLFVTVPAAIIAEKLCGDWSVLGIWFFFTIVDSIAGCYNAVIHGTFSRKHMFNWVRKVTVHISCLACLNMLLWSFSITSGEPNTFLNWLILLFTCSEAVSALNNFSEAGVSFPPSVLWFIHKARMKSMKTLAVACFDGDVSDYAKFEAPPDRRKYNTEKDNGLRRRESDRDDS